MTLVIVSAFGMVDCTTGVCRVTESYLQLTWWKRRSAATARLICILTHKSSVIWSRSRHSTFFLSWKKNRTVEQLSSSWKVALDKKCKERLQALKLCNVMLSTVPVENYPMASEWLRLCWKCALIKYCWWIVSTQHSISMNIESTCLSWRRHVSWASIISDVTYLL